MRLKDNYEYILFTNLAPVEHFEDLNGFQPLADDITSDINKIFDVLYKCRHDKFWSDTDAKICYRLLYNYIWRLNNTLYQLNSLHLANLVYEVIFNIFEEVEILFLDSEKYEMLKNYIKIKDIWFEEIDLKIIIKGEAK